MMTLESPPLTCVVKDRPYAVSIRIEDADGTVLQTIETTMTSSLDQSILPDRPLVVGPVYTLNPDLAGHPDGKLPGEPKPACPKAVTRHCGTDGRRRNFRARHLAQQRVSSR